ncbi:hypothetical protein FF098_010795 [Parvularcula flava]|uniref:DUF2306 domain-containing protein n=1 Tax=Aquisalinus luteolus TaxID=1566827 RepID=A0A8J3ER89_9PROT|nr:hypothetical protein [Aquisalinus luteolus]NHK28393.1 hypothetical protein [Aquisalinus luteolus]GGH98340.1 hypothetical protein GCM10011355_21700 [Aquisalinus luteolus]
MINLDLLFNYDSLAHNLNIFFHVFFGSFAILFGVIQMVLPKGTRLHRWIGRAFNACFTVVLCTAFIGFTVFEFRLHLAAVTVLTFYTLVTGNRAVALRGSRPRAFDIALAVIAIAVSVSYMAVESQFVITWGRPVIYSMVISLLWLGAWDLTRLILPRGWLQRIWVHDHLMKMIFSWGGLTSAAMGNLFPQYGTVAQLAPSSLATILIPIFWLLLNAGPKASSQLPA